MCMCICVCMYVCMCVYVCVCMHACIRSTHMEVRGHLVNLWQSVLSFHHVGPQIELKFFRLGGKHLYPLSHFTCPNKEVFRYLS